MKLKSFLYALLLLIPTTKIGAQIINTIAGASSGQGAAATSIGIVPINQAVDRIGNIYVAEPDKHIIKKLSVNGIFSVVAGNGISGFSGDGGQAIQAQLKSPHNVAIDTAGNLFIADPYDNRIRKVATNGIITTIAGNGTGGFSGDGGSATSAALNGPNAVTVDKSGNVYIADFSNIRVRKVDTNGIITTVAGTGTQGFDGNGSPAILTPLGFPLGVAVNDAGEIFITDVAANKIRKVDASGIITTVAGNVSSGFSGDGGPATSAKLNQPAGSVSLDSLGNIFIPDSYNNRIRKVDVNGTITTVAGNGIDGFEGDGNQATAAQLSVPTGVVVNDVGDVFITVNNRIRKISKAGIIKTIAGNGTGGYSGDGMPAISSELFRPSQVAADASGNILVVQDARVCKIDTSGIITTIAGTGITGYTGDGGSATSAQIDPFSSTIDTASGNIFLGSYFRVRKVNKNGVITTIAGTGTRGFSGDGGPATAAQFQIASAMTVDTKGNLYIVDRSNFRIRKIDTSGIITTIAGNGTNGFSGDGGPATSAEISFALGITSDTAGNLYISDGTTRIRKIDTNGNINTIAGNGTEGFSGDNGPATSAQLNHPGALAIDHQGNIIFFDYENNRLRKITTSGIISTIAGGGISYGDGGLATSADVPGISGITIDREGNIYLSDALNHRVRKITNGVLPLTLKQFTAQLKNKLVLLQWQTTNEINVSHYSIERSNNGKEFSYIGRKEALNNSVKNVYDFTDASPLQRANYYRLKGVDRDGRFTYSSIIQINTADNFIADFKVFPNPATSFLNVQITSGQAGQIVLQIADASGKTLQNQIYQSNGSTLSTSVSIKDLPAGLYYLLISHDNKTEKKSFIKQ